MLDIDENGQTVDNQRQALTEAIGHRQGWIIAEFSDEGINGAKGRDRRPDFDRPLKEVVRGKIDIVAVWSVDRLGRSLQDLVGFLGELNFIRCDLYLEKQEGIDSQDFAEIEAYRVEHWLAEPALALRQETLTGQSQTDQCLSRRPTANSDRWASRACGIGSA